MRTDSWAGRTTLVVANKVRRQNQKNDDNEDVLVDTAAAEELRHQAYQRWTLSWDQSNLTVLV